MTTENDGFNGIDQPLHELVEEARVTRSAHLANTFMESFFDRFAEAELAEEKKFLIDAGTFDQWLVEQGLLPDGISDDDAMAQAGKTSKRNYFRRMINRSAAFGKSVWPPFSIEPLAGGAGVSYEVRLLEYFVEKAPAEIAQRAMKYMINKGTHWGQLSAYMHSEPVQKRLAEKGAREVMMRFYGAESAVRLTFKNVSAQLGNLNDEMNGAYREARRLMAQPSS